MTAREKMIIFWRQLIQDYQEFIKNISTTVIKPNVKGFSKTGLLKNNGIGFEFGFKNNLNQQDRRKNLPNNRNFNK